MPKVCVGGAYDGLTLNGPTDEASCIRNEGRVEERGGSGGCAAAHASQTSDAESNTALHSFPLDALRAARDKYKASPLVSAINRANNDLAGEVRSVLLGSSDLQKEAFDVLLCLAYFANCLLDPQRAIKHARNSVFTPSLGRRVEDLAGRVAERVRDDQKRKALDDALHALRQLVGKSAVECAQLLDTERPSHGPDDENIHGPIQGPGDGPGGGLGEYTVDFVTPATQPPIYFGPSFVDVVGYTPPNFAEIVNLLTARRAIEDKARSLGDSPGKALGKVHAVRGGFVGRYEGCDIYFSQETGAHEVHGDIRAKYNALGGPDSVLRLPITDETTTPDGIGRFNHFSAQGSIYWNPHTGPMMVRANIRSIWASQGWELGSLGYPVTDEYRMKTLTPVTDNAIFWNQFENGAVLTSVDGTGIAVTAELGREALKDVVRRFFDEALHNADSSLGLEAQVDILEVSGWGYGFWASQSREIAYRLHGFYSVPVHDTTFELDVRLTFATMNAPTFIHPGSLALVVGLKSLKVTTHGFAGTTKPLADRLAAGVWSRFYPSPGEGTGPSWIPPGWIEVSDIPTGADGHGKAINVLGVQVTSDGGLVVLLNPMPEIFGGFRKVIAQQQLDAFAAG